MTQALKPSAKAEATGETVQTLRVQKEMLINAPPDIVFESLLEEMGPSSSMPMKVEAWPGGRWYRDLGNNTGHLWGHVQVIKPPTLLEICGPLFMSYPAISHVQYRLVAEGEATRLKFVHRAIGLIEAEHAKGVEQGWGEILENIRKVAEGRNRR
jgi:uncharacterized protein YndB with AHSA1/START domain